LVWVGAFLGAAKTSALRNIETVKTVANVAISFFILDAPYTSGELRFNNNGIIPSDLI